jgi:hypothetical protein
VETNTEASLLNTPLTMTDANAAARRCLTIDAMQRRPVRLAYGASALKTVCFRDVRKFRGRRKAIERRREQDMSSLLHGSLNCKVVPNQALRAAQNRAPSTAARRRLP